MRFGICGGLDQISTIVDAGADYLEPPVASFASPEQPDAVWHDRLALLRDTGLTAEAWNCLLPGDLKLTGPSADWDRYERYIDVAAERVSEAGARVVVFGSGSSRDIPVGYPKHEGQWQFARAVIHAAGALCGAGILLCVEPLRREETNLLNGIAETIAFIRGLSLPNVKCTADLYHMSVQGEQNSLASKPGAIGHAHVADTDREPPGRGMVDIGDFLAALHRGGYDGRVSIECHWKEFHSQAGPALRHLRAEWDRVRPRD